MLPLEDGTVKGQCYEKVEKPLRCGRSFAETVLLASRFVRTAKREPNGTKKLVASLLGS